MKKCGVLFVIAVCVVLTFYVFESYQYHITLPHGQKGHQFDVAVMHPSGHNNESAVEVFGIQWMEDDPDNTDATSTTGSCQNFCKEYPVFLGGVDVSGRPNLAVEFGKWDISKTCSDKERLKRWLYKARDKVLNKIKLTQEQGKNVTQFNMFVNLEDFNFSQHLCWRCMLLYRNIANEFEQPFPATPNKIVFINSPRAFQILLTIVRPILYDHTNKAISLFGSDKEEWNSTIFENVARDQLPRSFGGRAV